MVEELGSWLVLVVDVDDYTSLLYTIDLRVGQPYEEIAVHDMFLLYERGKKRANVGI